MPWEVMVVQIDGVKERLDLGRISGVMRYMYTDPLATTLSFFLSLHKGPGDPPS